MLPSELSKPVGCDEAAAFRPVVGEEDDDRVVELALVLECLDHPADVDVHPVDHRRVDLHLARGDGALVGGELGKRRPVLERVGVLGLRGRQQAERHLALEAALAQRLGPVVVDALVLVLVFLQRLERPVRRRERQVGEERPALLVGLPLLQVLDDLRGVEVRRVEVVRHGRVAAVLLELRQGDERGLRRAGVRLEVQPGAAQKRVGLVEAAPGRGQLDRHAEVPLAGHQRVVAGVVQQLGDGHDPVVEVVLVARGAARLGRAAAHPALAGDVVVRAGEQLGPRHGAERRGVEVGQPQAAVGQLVQVRRADLAAERPQVREAEIVGHDHQEVRPPVRRRRVSVRRHQQGARPDRQGAHRSQQALA